MGQHKAKLALILNPWCIGLLVHQHICKFSSVCRLVPSRFIGAFSEKKTLLEQQDNAEFAQFDPFFRIFVYHGICQWVEYTVLGNKGHSVLRADVWSRKNGQTVMARQL